MRGGSESVVLDAIWSALPEGRWISRKALKEATATDEDTLTRVIHFLTRWNFIESRTSPELQLRRKEGAIDPLKTVDLLQEVTRAKGPSSILTSGRRRVAERLACRICGGKSLSYAGGNMVECNRCHERQWYAIDVGQSSLNSDVDSGGKPSLLARILVRLGRPQPASWQQLSKPTLFYWFRCMVCKKICTDYQHGLRRYLTCQFCKGQNYFW